MITHTHTHWDHSSPDMSGSERMLRISCKALQLCYLPIVHISSFLFFTVFSFYGAPPLFHITLHAFYTFANLLWFLIYCSVTDSFCWAFEIMEFRSGHKNVWKEHTKCNFLEWFELLSCRNFPCRLLISQGKINSRLMADEADLYFSFFAWALSHIYILK